MTETMLLHLRKEEDHLIGICEKKFSIPEQGAMVGRMSTHVPPERAPQMLGWMIARVSTDDRVGLL
ncbi:MAG: hypothetical protein EXR59_02940 [Dehalococcoidia bacterium]|nr:hypothetical protein [Dehalococcoidia bacterium]